MAIRQAKERIRICAAFDDKYPNTLFSNEVIAALEYAAIDNISVSMVLLVPDKQSGLESKVIKRVTESRYFSCMEFRMYEPVAEMPPFSFLPSDSTTGHVAIKTDRDKTRFLFSPKKVVLCVAL